VNSTLKIQTPEAITLIEKIKAELKKRAELKAKRMLLKVPKRRAKRWGLDQLIGIAGLLERWTGFPHGRSCLTILISVRISRRFSKARFGVKSGSLGASNWHGLGLEPRTLFEAIDKPEKYRYRQLRSLPNGQMGRAVRRLIRVSSPVSQNFSLPRLWGAVWFEWLKSAEPIRPVCLTWTVRATGRDCFALET
jgi:hypothetical protein